MKQLIEDKTRNTEIKNFIGEMAIYDNEGQIIWGRNSKGGYQRLLDLRGWGAIQNLFADKKGAIDFKKAAKLQDDLGRWIADAINQKLKSTT